MTVRWTPEMDAALLEMERERVPFVEMAERLGVCAGVMHNRRDDLGISRRRGYSGRKAEVWSDQQLALLRRGWRDHETTINTIARTLGMSPSKVIKKAEALGLGPKPTLRVLRDEADEQIIAFVKANPGCGSREIINATGLDKDVVMKALQRMANNGRCRSRTKRLYFAN